MDKTAFKPETRYTVTLRDEQGRLRPANIYVYRAYDAFMVVRFTASDGLLHKLAYEDVVKLVKETPVDADHIYHTPAALLDESTWRERKVMEHYATAPGLGK